MDTQHCHEMITTNWERSGEKLFFLYSSSIHNFHAERSFSFRERERVKRLSCGKQMRIFICSRTYKLEVHETRKLHKFAVALRWRDENAAKAKQHAIVLPRRRHCSARKIQFPSTVLSKCDKLNYSSSTSRAFASNRCCYRFLYSLSQSDLRDELSRERRKWFEAREDGWKNQKRVK